MCGGEGGYLHDECEDKNFSVQKEMYLEFHSSPVVSVDQTSQVFTKCTVGCDKKVLQKKVGGPGSPSLPSFVVQRRFVV